MVVAEEPDSSELCGLQSNPSIKVDAVSEQRTSRQSFTNTSTSHKKDKKSTSVQLVHQDGIFLLDDGYDAILHLH